MKPGTILCRNCGITPVRVRGDFCTDVCQHAHEVREALSMEDWGATFVSRLGNARIMPPFTITFKLPANVPLVHNYHPAEILAHELFRSNYPQGGHYYRLGEVYRL